MCKYIYYWMNWVENDNLNIIFTEGAGNLLNASCELEITEGNNKKIWKHGVPFKKKLDKISCPLYLDKQIFCHFPVV